MQPLTVQVNSVEVLFLDQHLSRCTHRDPLRLEGTETLATLLVNKALLKL
jgi:hypothetical protein